MHYCDFVASIGPDDTVHKYYHDHVYGFSLEDDNEIFGQFILEINQAGLSWDTVLKRGKSIRQAYSDFNIAAIAGYKEIDISRLLSNAEIIRNKSKINSIIHNANAILTLQAEHGSFLDWLDKHHPLSTEDWVILFRENFKFVGFEIVNSLLMCIGYLEGAHVETCPIYAKTLLFNPAWKRAK